jgi:hypothetical protein
MRIVKSYLEFLNEDVVGTPTGTTTASTLSGDTSSVSGNTSELKKLADNVAINLIKQCLNNPLMGDVIQKIEVTPNGKIFNIMGKRGLILSYGADNNYWYNDNSTAPNDKSVKDSISQFINSQTNYIKLVKPTQPVKQPVSKPTVQPAKSVAPVPAETPPAK